LKNALDNSNGWDFVEKNVPYMLITFYEFGVTVY